MNARYETALRRRSRAASRYAVRLLLFSVSSLVCVSAFSATEHPTLVNVEQSACMACHEDLIAGKAQVHAPAADDCTMCHEFSKTDEGTTVTLADEDPALCVMCHDELSRSVDADWQVPHFPVTDSCRNCHDPHASDQLRLLSSTVGELCSSCHDSAELQASHGEQLTPATDCTSCHAPHGGDQASMLTGSQLHAPFAEGSCSGCHRKPFGERIRLRSRGERLCTSCHTDVETRERDGLRVHGAMQGESGRAGCLECHDPHMGQRSHLLVDSGAGLCRTCHSTVVEASLAETGHAAAADDCMLCHQPHSSESPALLTASTFELCSMCHDPADDGLRQSHLGADLAQLDCLGCHTPHGSGHDSLLAENIHAPIEDGCDLCHEGAADQLAEDGSSDLCLMCHDDVGQMAADAEVPHVAMELVSCSECHNPHASRQPKLVKYAEGRICTSCHEDQAPGDGEFAHGAMAAIGCQSCHEPHGSANSLLMRASGQQLCMACHDRDAVLPKDDQTTVLVMDRFEFSAEEAHAMGRIAVSDDGEHGHPTPAHRFVGQPTPEEMKTVKAEFDDELSCLTCHDPHKGRSQDIFRWGAASSMEACLQCHPKK